MSKLKIILVGGPTASGKSAFALDLARKMNGTIINTDAMQIYSRLPILTAQPSAEDRREVPHLLYGIFEPSERSSAGKWLELARLAIRKTTEEGRHPILVGGTGLYFKALLGGLADIPSIPEEVRIQAQELYIKLGEEKFRSELAKIDTESATKLAKNDRQRLIRAYEVATHTRKPIGIWHKKTSGTHKEFSIEHHLLMPERDKLYAACDKRFESMIEQGAVEEVRHLLALGLDPGLPAMKILGVREITFYLNGEWALGEAIAKAQQATRNYAKRQMTWFRNQWVFD